MTKDELYFYFMIGVGILFIFAGPFAWWINLIIVMGVALCILAFPLFIIYAVASGISYARQTESDAWEYWEKMKVHKWEELSDEEKQKLIVSCEIINNDVGTIRSKEQIVTALKEQLPIKPPRIGLIYSSL